MKLLLLAVLASRLLAADLAALPRDYAKEAWVHARLTQLGLNNEIRVVREPGLVASNVCAYATESGGIQYISYDPACVTSLDPANPNYLWSAGVMLHEIAHHLSGATSTTGKTSMENEVEAERWVGWAFRYSGVSLAQAMVYARSGQENPSDTHPGTVERVKAVESGWRKADEVLSGSAARPTSAPSATSVDKLAAAARRGLQSLGGK